MTFALFGIIEIYTLKSKKILDAEIIGFKSNSEYDLEDNVNFDLEIKILLPDNKIQNANIKALYLRKPILGKAVKIILNEQNINESKIYTGTELFQYLIKIFV